MYAIRSYYAERAVTAVETDSREGRVTLDDGTVLSAPLIIAADSRMSENRRRIVITSYSIHYTKLYEIDQRPPRIPWIDRRIGLQ